MLWVIFSEFSRPGKQSPIYRFQLGYLRPLKTSEHSTHCYHFIDEDQRGRVIWPRSYG